MPIDYITYKSNHPSYQEYTQTITFSSSYTQGTDNQIGQVTTSDQIPSSYSDLTSQETDPFLLLPLDDTKIVRVTLQNFDIYTEPIGQDVYLTPSNPGIHLPDTLYTYMNDNFFTYLCSPEMISTELKPLLTFEQCQCQGQLYFGMPSLQMFLDMNGKSTDWIYDIQASSFELFPKIDDTYRETYCNLGLWSINFMDNYGAESEAEEELENSFAMG